MTIVLIIGRRRVSSGAVLCWLACPDHRFTGHLRAMFEIREYSKTDEETVIDIWRKCDLIVPWNDPRQDIERKLAMNDGLFLVSAIDGEVIATVMGGYEGHRGWIYYLAVLEEMRHSGIGSKLVAAVEEKLIRRGCPKINLMVRSSNKAVQGFYHKLGYKISDVICMGKFLI